MTLLLRLTALLLFTGLSFSSVTSAEESAPQAAVITELTATTSKTHLIMFGMLKNSFTTEMIEVLHSGIPLRFTFFVELDKTVTNRPNEQIIAFSFEHTMAFDTLKESYQITLEEDNNRVQSFKSLDEAKKMVNEINGVKVVSLDQLLPDNRYQLRIKADLFEKTLPLSLQSIFPFLSWGDIETEWHAIEFTY
jgi:hypothetical protein